jgi:hypothetical protein
MPSGCTSSVVSVSVGRPAGDTIVLKCWHPAVKPRALARINIYVPDPAVRRLVKAAAAKRDLSVSDYCLQAITAQLVRDGEKGAVEAGATTARTAVARARRFQAQTFKGRQFQVSSASLIREGRPTRSVGA